MVGRRCVKCCSCHLVLSPPARKYLDWHRDKVFIA